MTTNQNSPEILQDQILADARKRGQEIIAQAQRDAKNILDSAAAEAERIHQEKLENARAEAARRSELILATVPVETGRMKSARIENLLESVREEAQKRLLSHDDPGYRETVVTLAAHAVRQMAGDDFVVKFAESDRVALGDGLPDDIARRAGRPVNITISPQPGMTGGGVVVEDAEARQMWDNRLTMRLERLWPELRRRIAAEAAFVPKKE